MFIMIYQFSNKLKKIPIVGQAKQGAGNESDQQNKNKTKLW
jgi:hypothetical protein